MAKVLLVEDNEMNRDMLSRRLTKKGFEVVMAVDGRQGVDMASSESPGHHSSRHEPAGDGRVDGGGPPQIGRCYGLDTDHCPHGSCAGR